MASHVPSAASHLESLPVEMTDKILRLVQGHTQRVRSVPAYTSARIPYSRHSVADIASLSLASKALYSRAMAHLYRSVFLRDTTVHQVR